MPEALFDCSRCVVSGFCLAEYIALTVITAYAIWLSFALYDFRFVSLSTSIKGLGIALPIGMQLESP